MVTEIGGLDAAIAAAAKAAELDEWTVEEYPRPRTLEEQIFDSFFGEFTTRLPFIGSDPLTKELVKLHDQLQALELMQDPNGIYLRLPFTLEIN